MTLNLVRRGVLPALAFAIVFCFIASTAQAEQCTTRIDLKQAPEATKFVKRAKEALATGRFAAALALFEHAYCILPEPILKHGISSAELNLNRCGDALQDARFWVSHSTRADKDEARNWLRDVLNQCVEVSIRTSPEGAALRIDGAAPLTAPWLGRLRVGPHSVLAAKPGEADTEAKFAVTAGNNRGPIPIEIAMLPELPLPPLPPEAAAAAPMALKAALPAPTHATPPPPAIVQREIPPAAVAPAASRNNGTFVATWIVLGVGIVSAVLGASFGTSANACPHTESTPVGVRGALQCQSNNDTAANVSWAIAGASAITAGGLALSWALPHKSSERQNVSLAFAPSGAGLALNF